MGCLLDLVGDCVENGRGRRLPAVIALQASETVEMAEHGCYHTWNTGDRFKEYDACQPFPFVHHEPALAS